MPDNNIGGIQTRVLAMTEHLRRRHCDMLFITPYGDGGFTRLVNKKGFTSAQARISMPKLSSTRFFFVRNLLWVIAFPLATTQIIQIVRKEKATIIHAYGLLSLHAVIASRITGVPLVWQLIGTLYPPWFVRALRPLIRLAPKKIIMPSMRNVAYYLGEEESHGKLLIIHNGVDTDRFCPSAISSSATKEYLESLNLNGSHMIVGLLGNINPDKGLEYYVDAASLVKSRYNRSVKFLIIGATPQSQKDYEGCIRRRINYLDLDDDVLITGYCDKPEIPLSAIDVFVLSSTSEGAPVAVLEAMSMSKAIVATDVGGVSEMVEHGQSGLLVPRKNAAALADAIQVFLESDSLRRSHGERARTKVIDEFNIHDCQEELLSLYLGLSS